MSTNSRLAEVSFLWALIVVTTNQRPQLGAVGAYFFEGQNESQIWLTVEPEALQQGPTPLALNVTVSFPGRRLIGPPRSATIRAQAYRHAYPLFIRRPFLAVTLNTDRDIDLLQFDSSYQFVPSCRGCSSDTLVARVPFAILRDIANSTVAYFSALGFAVRLTDRHREQLRSFVKLASNEVVVK